MKYFCTKGYRKTIGPVANTALAIFTLSCGTSVRLTYCHFIFLYCQPLSKNPDKYPKAAKISDKDLLSKLDQNQQCDRP